MDRKYHAKFHAAVLRNLYASNPPSEPPNALATAVSIAQEPLNRSLITQRANKHPDNVASHSEGDESSIAAPSLSRAQRKHLRLKKLKENHFQLVEAKSHRLCLIGPSPLEPQRQVQQTEALLDTIFCPDACNQRGVKTLDGDHNAFFEFDKHEEKESLDHGFCGPNSNLSTKTRKRNRSKERKSNNAENQRGTGLPFTADVNGNELIIRRAGKPVN